MIKRNKNALKPKIKKVDKNYDYIIYTDGSADNANEPHYGASAFVILEKTGQDICYEGVEGYKGVTNNQMEINAIIQAVSSIPDGSSCLIRTDSKYCMFVLDHTNRWFPKNMAYISEFRNVVEEKDINYKFEHVRGHSTDNWNIYVDRMASKKMFQVSGRLLDNKHELKRLSAKEMIDIACDVAGKYMVSDILEMYRKDLIDKME